MARQCELLSLQAVAPQDLWGVSGRICTPNLRGNSGHAAPKSRRNALHSKPSSRRHSCPHDLQLVSTILTSRAPVPAVFLCPCGEASCLGTAIRLSSVDVIYLFHGGS